MPRDHAGRQLSLDQGATPDRLVIGASVGARQRLGAAPRARLFDQFAHLWTPAARLIECRIGGQLQRYLISLPDPRRYPAREIVAHCVQRWEIEPGFRQIKQGMLHNAPVLRSKQPALAGRNYGAPCWPMP